MSKDRRLPREFNPLHPRNLARGIADALNDEPLLPLPPAERFEGAGVYALYYLGQFEPYETDRRREETDLCRQGGSRRDRVQGSHRISMRLLARYSLADSRSTRNQLTQPRTWTSADFKYRALVVDPFYANVAEVLLIQRWKPIWNKARSLDSASTRLAADARRSIDRYGTHSILGAPTRRSSRRTRRSQRTSARLSSAS